MAKKAKKSDPILHVRRGDNVVVLKGKEQGKRGKVKRLVSNGRLEIEKVNMIKRHTRPTQQNPNGGIIDQEGSMAAANVALWCDKCVAGRRARKLIDDSGDKTRVCVKCGSPFPAPGM
jgi:large subunit ribosomal protein L24